MKLLRKMAVLSLRRLEDERGIALVFAIVTTAALGIITTTVLVYSATSARTSGRTSADQQAYSLAEAGINTAIAKIYGASDPRATTNLHAGTVADPAAVVPQCPGANNNETPTCYSTGSVTYSGTLDTTQGNTWYWTIKSIGAVTVPGVTTVKRTLTRSLGVTGNNGTDGSSWTRFYQDSASKCLTLDGVSVPTNFASRGDICLVNGATVTGAQTNMNAGGNIYVDPPETEDPARNLPTSSNCPCWTSPGNAYKSDTLYASTPTLANNTNSPYLDLSNFGFNVPTSATISGILVSIQRKAGVNSAANYITDTDVWLMKADGATVGTNHAQASTVKWPIADVDAQSQPVTQPYGSTSDLWGTTWSAANVNASTFGVRIRAHGTCTTCNSTVTGYLNAVTVTVYWTTGASIGTSGSPIAETDVGGGCKFSGNALHTTCSGSDKVYVTTANTVLPADNPAISMPDIDWNYWWANAKPGPKHFCTNTNPGISTTFFDNNSATTTKPDASLTVNGEMAQAGHPYDCEVWENGVLQGMMKWDGSHRLDVYGTIFVDGNFRWDEDGEIVHYFGRATIMSSHDDEIDALICSGGTGNTYATSCLANMNTWSPSQNMLVLMSQCQKGLTSCNEYDQGGTSCSGSPTACYNGHLPAGFQGILYSLGDCLIHQNFQDSGPVICNTISMPNEGTGMNPTFFSFPSVGNLTNGMSFSSTASADNFTLNVSAQGDG
jgi:Tfp pilus assembly protein PilX